MTRPFGSINIAAEMAVAMGADPRPYLTEEQIEKQAKLGNMTVEEWNAKCDRLIAERVALGDGWDCPF
jgi:hypothetical protein